MRDAPPAGDMRADPYAQAICFGDSGSPTFFNPPIFGLFDLSVVAVASDGGIDWISADYRARVDTAAVQHWISDTIHQQLVAR
jgi:hypothetical protein